MKSYTSSFLLILSLFLTSANATSTSPEVSSTEITISATAGTASFSDVTSVDPATVDMTLTTDISRTIEITTTSEHSNTAETTVTPDDSTTIISSVTSEDLATVMRDPASSDVTTPKDHLMTTVVVTTTSTQSTPKTTTAKPIECQNGGTPQPNNLACICPPGFTGTHCSNVESLTPDILTTVETTATSESPNTVETTVTPGESTTGLSSVTSEDPTTTTVDTTSTPDILTTIETTATSESLTTPETTVTPHESTTGISSVTSGDPATTTVDTTPTPDILTTIETTATSESSTTPETTVTPDESTTGIASVTSGDPATTTVDTTPTPDILTTIETTATSESSTTPETTVTPGESTTGLSSVTSGDPATTTVDTTPTPDILTTTETTATSETSTTPETTVTPGESTTGISSVTSEDPTTTTVDTTPTPDILTTVETTATSESSNTPETTVTPCESTTSISSVTLEDPTTAMTDPASTDVTTTKDSVMTTVYVTTTSTQSTTKTTIANSIVCENGGTPQPNNLACICPPGFTGTHCNTVEPQITLKDNIERTVKVDMEINEEFTPEHENPSSDQYKEFVQRFNKKVEPYYSKISNFDRVDNIILSAGGPIKTIRRQRGKRSLLLKETQSLNVKHDVILNITNDVHVVQNYDNLTKEVDKALESIINDPGGDLVVNNANATKTDLNEVCLKATEDLGEVYQKYYETVLLDRKVTCVTGCNRAHSEPKTCWNNGICEVTKQGPSCNCLDDNWYLGEDCSFLVHKDGFYGGLGTVIVITIAFLTVYIAKNKLAVKRKYYIVQKLDNVFKWLPQKKTSGGIRKKNSFGEDKPNLSADRKCNQNFSPEPDINLQSLQRDQLMNMNRSQIRTSI
ncbi:mucin-17-like isoform X1 [Chanodichthys erythropterus]|uniref:mucin-17-like isoform X1 n=1 Tax=Chanodichthys erythropterus TaxID=933992 RepID=UPI00351F0B8A